MTENIKMKVSIVCPDFNITNIRKQPWRTAFEIAKHMSRYVSDVRIITNDNNGSLLDYDINNIRIHVLYQKNIRYPTEKFRDLVQRICPDIILWFGNALSGLYIKKYKFLNIPIVLYITQSPLSLIDFSHLRMRKIWQYKYDFFLSALFPFNKIIRLLNDNLIKRVIVSSKSIRIKLINLGVSSRKIFVAPLIFDNIDDYNISSININEARKRIKIDSDLFVLTYYGGSNTIRGTDTIINSVKSMKSKHIDDILVLLLLRRETNIPDNDELYLRSIIKKYELNEQVKIISKILSRQELLFFLFLSDIILLPFKIVPSEPPIGVLEGLSFGKSVITTEISGLREIVTSERGVLITPSNVGELQETIMFLMESPMKRFNLGRHAEEFVSRLPGSEFLAEWTAYKLLQVLKPNRV
ncbi:MAG: glycosyltransferase [Candidatus Hodarchaeota archaeon]